MIDVVDVVRGLGSNAGDVDGGGRDGTADGGRRGCGLELVLGFGEEDAWCVLPETVGTAAGTAGAGAVFPFGGHCVVKPGQMTYN